MQDILLTKLKHQYMNYCALFLYCEFISQKSGTCSLLPSGELYENIIRIVKDLVYNIHVEKVIHVFIEVISKQVKKKQSQQLLRLAEGLFDVFSANCQEKQKLDSIAFTMFEIYGLQEKEGMMQVGFSDYYLQKCVRSEFISRKTKECLLKEIFKRDATQQCRRPLLPLENMHLLITSS